MREEPKMMCWRAAGSIVLAQAPLKAQSAQSFHRPLKKNNDHFFIFEYFLIIFTFKPGIYSGMLEEA